MITYKNSEALSLMKISGDILSKLHGEIAKNINPGVKQVYIDKIAEEFILDHNAIPSFKGYGGFPASVCISVNDCIVHGVPSSNEFREGDVISIDCGVCYKGYHTDSAYTHLLGSDFDERVVCLVKCGKDCLDLGIKEATVEKRIGDIGFAIEQRARQDNFFVADDLVGHGIGLKLHEKPAIPNVGMRGKGAVIKNGMTFCIEPMINMSTSAILCEKNGAIKTKNRCLSVHFEKTVAIIDDVTVVLTTFDYI